MELGGVAILGCKHRVRLQSSSHLDSISEDFYEINLGYEIAAYELPPCKKNAWDQHCAFDQTGQLIMLLQLEWKSYHVRVVGKSGSGDFQMDAVGRCILGVMRYEAGYSSFGAKAQLSGINDALFDL